MDRAAIGHRDVRREATAVRTASDPQTYAVIGAAQKAHRALGPGFKEATYETALRTEFSGQGIPFQSQPEFIVHYAGEVCGTYCPDLVAYGRIVIELKAVADISPDHIAQTLSYLRATGLPVALLLNFGKASLQYRRFDNKTQKQIP